MILMAPPPETTRMSPYHVAEHRPAKSEPTSSHWTKQLIWLRTNLCGGWCLRMALCTPSGAC